MPLTSRCALCGKLIDRDSAYVAISAGKRKYYCSKIEYDGGMSYVKERQKFEDKIENSVKYIIGCDIFDSVLYATEYNIWLKNAKPEVLYYFLLEKKETLRVLITNKDIKNATNRLKFLSKVIQNKILSYEYKQKNDDIEAAARAKVNLDYAEYKPRLEPRKTIRRSLVDIEEDL